jgi:hypothetical protein
MTGIFRQGGRDGLAFEPPKRAVGPPAEATDGATAEEVEGGAREVGKPPGLTFEPPRRHGER